LERRFFGFIVECNCKPNVERTQIRKQPARIRDVLDAALVTGLHFIKATHTIIAPGVEKNTWSGGGDLLKR
jgi:hypothetical protein